MEFARPKPPRTLEPTLPMINVVFLLLIFFLISAQIVTPPPLEVTPPVGDGAHVDNPLQLHITADGTLAYEDSRGDAVWVALADAVDPEMTTVLIRADAALPAAELAKILAQTAALGFATVQLEMTTP